MEAELPEAVTVSFHNIPLSVLREFAKKFVGPYFGGNWNEALATLMDKTLIEEELFQAHLDKRRVIF